MKRIPPGQIDRFGRQLEKLASIYIERWLKKGYMGAEEFDEVFCKIFEMLNSESGVAASTSSGSYQRSGRMDEEFDEDPYPSSGRPRTPNYSGRSHYSPPPAIARGRSSAAAYGKRSIGYKPKSTYYKRRSGR